MNILKLAIIGICAGFITGFFSAGGGMLILPAIIYLMNIEENIKQIIKDAICGDISLEEIEIEIPKNNRIVKKIRCMHDLSKTGLSGDEKKVNQDSYFILFNIYGADAKYYFAVIF